MVFTEEWAILWVSKKRHVYLIKMESDLTVAGKEAEWLRNLILNIEM